MFMTVDRWWRLLHLFEIYNYSEITTTHEWIVWPHLRYQVLENLPYYLCSTIHLSFTRSRYGCKMLKKYSIEMYTDDLFREMFFNIFGKFFHFFLTKYTPIHTMHKLLIWRKIKGCVSNSTPKICYSHAHTGLSNRILCEHKRV